MKYCPYCGSGLKDNMMFCPKCGKAFEDVVESSDSVQIIFERNINDACKDVTIDGEKECVCPHGEINFNVNLQEEEKVGRKKKKVLVFVFVFCILCIAVIATIIAMWQKENVADDNGASSVIVTSPKQNVTDLQLPVKELTSNEIAKLSKSVLTLHVYDQNKELLSTGSGFIVCDDKTIVTNYHVIDKGYYVEAFSEDGECYNIDGVFYYDEGLDIAVLYFEAGTRLSPLTIADSSTVEIGDTVYAIGSPLGLSNTLSNGLVSAIREEEGYTDIQITAPISSGSSGGALLNVYGEVIGITYASYSEGQNLNLAVPSNEFSEKLNQNVFESFSDVALFERDLGNTLENYSVNETRFVQYGNVIYESYNANDEIFVYECDTGIRKSLGLYGTNLSVYKNTLYFVTTSQEAICAYNLSTCELNANILLDYPKEAHVTKIYELYISDFGISVMYSHGFLKSALVQLDFEGSIVGIVEELSLQSTIIEEGVIVSPDYKNLELDFVQLYDCDTFSITLDFEPGACVFSEGFLYISDTTESTYGALVKYDLATGNIERLAKVYANTYGCFINDEKVYYPATNGTGKISIYGGEQSILTKKYSLSQICFSDDGYMYAIGTEPSADFLKYTEYYIRMSVDGMRIEELDRKEIDYLNGVY